MKKTIALAAALSLSTFLPVPCIAQGIPLAAQSAERSAHEQLYEAMMAGVDQETMIEGQLRSVRAVWEADANLIVAERQFPGLMAAMIDAARPIIKRMTLESNAKYRPRMIAVMKTVLDDQEAIDAAEFYMSPIGRKLLGGLATHADARRTIEGYIENQEIDENDMRRDLKNTTGKVVAQLTDEELQQLGRLAMEKPALMKLDALGEALVPVRMEMEREAMASKLQAEMAVAIEAAVKRHIARK